MSERTLPTDSQERKRIPLARGFLYYFPAAMAEVARLSREGNKKHNPGEPMHHARGKSTDHADCILRHQAEAGTLDDDGFYHDVKVAWRAMAQLQELLESLGAPLAPRALLPGEDPFEKWPVEGLSGFDDERRQVSPNDDDPQQPGSVYAEKINQESLTVGQLIGDLKQPPGDRHCLGRVGCYYPNCGCPRKTEDDHDD